MRENKLKRLPITQVPMILVLLLLSTSASAGKDLEVDEKSASKGHDYRVLVTNDDGIDSPGVWQLASAIAEFADVVVVAPAKNESGASQSSRLFGVRVQLTPVDMGDTFSAYSLNSSPTDCVAVGVSILGQDKPFDLVVSGVNAGQNLGSSYLYSGTIGAAFQGLVDGIPAIAVSQENQRESLDLTIDFTMDVVRSVLAEPTTRGELISINVPAGEIRGVKVLPADMQRYRLKLTPTEDESGVFYKPSIHPLDKPHEGQDVEAFRSGYITVTPLKLNRNAYDSLDALSERPVFKAWFDDKG